MRNCPQERLIDDYLLNKLSQKEKDLFETHYFNCPVCFETMEQRNQVISVVKQRGKKIFQANTTGSRNLSLLKRILSGFKPKQWIVAAVAVSVCLVVILGIFPGINSPSPRFVVNDHVVRGNSINLIFPLLSGDGVTSQFKWDPVGEDTEYKISLYNHDILWSATTTRTVIDIPDEIQSQMVEGGKYFWQVKAFSPNGPLISISSRLEFKFRSSDPDRETDPL